MFQNCYELKHGIGIFMLAKIVVIIFSIIVFKCGCLLKNDMAEFNKEEIKKTELNEEDKVSKINININYRIKIYYFLTLWLRQVQGPLHLNMDM